MTPKAKGLPSLAVLRRIAAYLRPYAWPYSGAIVGIGMANLFINIFMARIILDLISGLQRSSEETLAATTRDMVVLGTFLVVWVFFSVVPLFLTVNRFQNDIRLALFRKFTSAPLGEIESRHSGDLLSRSNTDLRQVSSIFRSDLQALLSVLMPGIGCGVFMVMLDVRMGVVGILCGAVPLLVNLPFAEPLRRTGRDVQEKNATFIERMSDILRGADTIRHLNLSGFAASRAREGSEGVQSSTGKQVRLDSLRQLVDSASTVSQTAYLAYVSYIAIRDPSLMPAAVAMGQLSSSVKFMFSNLGGILSNIQTNVGGAERILDLLDIPNEPETAVAPDPLVSHPVTAETALAVSGLTFRYAGSDGPALVDVSFSTPAGRRVALVGPSGGGKSTLVKVLLGLYQPQKGAVSALGKSIYETPLKEWRTAFSYVPQEPFLFAGTIYDNILGGREDPGEERIEQAARLANAHDFIVAMQDGYRSAVGERGANLSGGQRQRIAIARAILKDAPVLLLDEATSSLDAESEALVQEALDRLMAGRTTVVVAHRLSTVREADEILYVAGGRILERGSHDELMDRNGQYKSLVSEGSILREQQKEVAT